MVTVWEPTASAKAWWHSPRSSKRIPGFQQGLGVEGPSEPSEYSSSTNGYGKVNKAPGISRFGSRSLPTRDRLERLYEVWVVVRNDAGILPDSYQAIVVGEDLAA